MIKAVNHPSNRTRPESVVLLLFQEEHKPKIINQQKDETRRLWSPNYPRPRVGSYHLAYTRPPWIKKNPGRPFARLLILDVYKEMLGMIGPESVMAEGYQYYMDFMGGWIRSYGTWDPGQVIDVVKFKVVEVYDD